DLDHRGVGAVAVLDGAVVLDDDAGLAFAVDAAAVGPVGDGRGARRGDDRDVGVAEEVGAVLARAALLSAALLSDGVGHAGPERPGVLVDRTGRGHGDLVLEVGGVLAPDVRERERLRGRLALYDRDCERVEARLRCRGAEPRPRERRRGR